VNKIKVGLLIDDLIIPFWCYKMIERIVLSDFAEVVLVVQKKGVADKKSFAAQLQDNYKYFFYKLYKKVESKISKPNPNASEEKDLRVLVKNAHFLEVQCLEKENSDYLEEPDVSRISEHDTDVLLKLGFRNLRGSILNVPKMGVWCFHYGDHLINKGGPAAFWEVFNNEREIGSTLQILTENVDGGHILYRSWSRVNRLHQDTLNALYWKNSLVVERKLRELYVLGKCDFLKRLKSENNTLQFYSNPLYTLPGNYLFLKLFTAYFINWVRHRAWKLFNSEQWILLYCINTKSSPATSIYNYKRLIPPKDRFWADPFVIFENDRYFIFFEELVYKGERKGHLSVMEIDGNGICSSPTIILKQPYHLSYPFVFKYEGEYYMIPESQQNSTIELYKALNFPYKWEFKMNLMEKIRAVDTTIFLKDDRVWLFTNIVETAGAPSSEELFLFSSDSLLSTKWQSHPLNPIVSDVKSARSAGRIFQHKGKLYRPSQDCSYMYGYSTSINEVLVMNEKEYKEVKVSDISPNWADDVIATHTFSYDNKLSAIDAVVKRSKALF
jgi:hypothetical protein